MSEGGRAFPVYGSMESRVRTLSWFFILWMGWATGAAAAPLTLIYSGNLNGELEPCGCSVEGNLGGLLRRATVIDRLRAENPDLFLVSGGGLMSGFAANGRLTNEYILKGFAALDYDALGVQWSDLTYGADLSALNPLPWVASNWRGEQFPRERTVTRGGQDLSFFTWLDTANSPDQAMLGDHAQASADTRELAAGLARARRAGALTVLSTTLDLAAAERQLPLEHVDVLLIRANYETYGEPQRRGRTLVLQAGSRGMRLGRVDLQRDADGVITEWRHTVIPMPPSVPDAPRLAAWYAEYSAKIKEAYARAVALRKAQEQGQTPYAGESECKTCHRAAYDTWNASRHAQAFLALEEVNKSFDPYCIECHTVGFKEAGGFIDIEVTGQLSNVQCESCHGAARDHVASAGAKPVGKAGLSGPQMCAQCHTQPHSPSFDFSKYWPRIAH